MTRKTRLFMGGSAAILVAGLGTGLVAYYGGGIPQLLPDTPRCPMMFHFGERDSHIPLSDVDQVRKANPQGIFHLYPAGHGFNCSERGDYDAASARLASDRTLAFLARHLETPQDDNKGATDEA